MLKLNAAQIGQYLRDSSVTVETGLPAEFQQNLLRKTDKVFEKHGDPGNNLLARQPKIGKLLSDSAVAGVFVSILDDDYDPRTAG